MACLENPSSSTASSEHITNCPPLMSPRISFSNDFAESHYYAAHNHNHNQVMVMRSHKQSPTPIPTSSDFEFSVSAGNNNNSNLSHMMTTADELFHKGHLLPFKPCSKTTTTTLRDELLLQEEDDDHDQVMSLTFRPPKTSTNWKGFLGIKPKKSPPHKITITSQQEMLNDGGSSCRDVEIGR